jgi:hypothetical protein
MNDKMGLSGEVTVTVIKADGTKKKTKQANAIDSNLKVNIATGMYASVTYGLNTNVFSTDNFATPDANGSGIIIKDSGGNYKETKNTSIGNPASGIGVKVQSSTRNNSGSTITLANAYLGRSYNSGADFDVDYASVANTTAVADGQQIDLSWEVKIA